MIKKDIIFLCIISIWFISIMIEIIFFPDFGAKYGVHVNLFFMLIVLSFTIPKLTNKKYNNWLESNIVKKILTIKETRNKKLLKLKKKMNILKTKKN